MMALNWTGGEIISNGSAAAGGGRTAFSSAIDTANALTVTLYCYFDTWNDVPANPQVEVWASLDNNTDNVGSEPVFEFEGTSYKMTVPLEYFGARYLFVTVRNDDPNVGQTGIDIEVMIDQIS